MATSKARRTDPGTAVGITCGVLAGLLLLGVSFALVRRSRRRRAVNPGARTKDRRRDKPKADLPDKPSRRRQPSVFVAVGRAIGRLRFRRRVVSVEPIADPPADQPADPPADPPAASSVAAIICPPALPQTAALASASAPAPNDASVAPPSRRRAPLLTSDLPPGRLPPGLTKAQFCASVAATSSLPGAPLGAPPAGGHHRAAPSRPGGPASPKRPHRPPPGLKSPPGLNKK